MRNTTLLSIAILIATSSYVHSAATIRTGNATNRSVNNISQLRSQISAARNRSGNTVITLNNGTYTLTNTINLYSNTHLRVKPRVTFKKSGAQRVMFGIGRTGSRVNNVSITGTNGKYTVDLRGNERARFCSVISVSNCLIADANFLDTDSIFSSIGTGSQDGTSGKSAKNITIRDCSQTGGRSGYGLVQTQGGSDILYQRLRYSGNGVCVRFETGTEAATGAFNHTARNLTSRGGQCGIIFQPHTLDSRALRITGVTTVGSFYGARLAKGFVDRKAARTGRNRAGVIRASFARNVRSTYRKNLGATEKPERFIKWLTSDSDFAAISRANARKAQKLPTNAVIFRSKGTGNNVQATGTAINFPRNHPNGGSVIVTEDSWVSGTKVRSRNASLGL